MPLSTIFSSNYKWWVFGAIALGTFVSVISAASVPLALSTIGKHFDADLSTVQWVTIGETLFISVFLLPAGRIADIIGRKKVYVIGLIIFALTSVMAGSATFLGMLIAAKALQGVGSAMIQANGMAMIVSVFPSEERGKALGLHLGVVGTGAILGPVISGVLIDAFGWEAVFLINVPTAVIAIAASVLILNNRRISQDAAAGRAPAFDWGGAVLSAAALLVFLLTITNGNRLGWDSVLCATGLALSVGSGLAFIWWELRVPNPMLDLRLFNRPVFARGVAAGWLSFLGVVSAMFLMPIYLQDVLGYSPREAGLILISGAVAMTLVGPIAGGISDKVGWRKLTVAGMVLSSASLFALAATLDENTSLPVVIVLVTAQMTGLGLFISPNTSSILSAVERHRYGVVSALTQLTRNTASVVGIAALTAIVVATMASMGVESTLDAVAEEPRAFVIGVQRALWAMGGLMVIGLVISAFTSERRREVTEPTPQVELSEVTSD